MKRRAGDLRSGRVERSGDRSTTEARGEWNGGEAVPQQGRVASDAAKRWHDAALFFGGEDAEDDFAELGFGD